MWTTAIYLRFNLPKKFRLKIEFSLETTGYGFDIMISCLVHLMHSLISLVNDNHMDNNLKEILVFVYFGLFVNNPKSVCSMGNSTDPYQTML